MSEIRDVFDSSPEAGSLTELSDPSKRRDHYTHLFSCKSKKIGIADIQHVILWLQDPWSEIRKDCARWIKSNRLDILPDTETLLLRSLIDCIRCDRSSWQATHGSLLGITQLICQTCVQSICYEVRDLCLSLVGSNLAPVREAATACVCKLVSSGKISTAVLISTIQLSVLNLYEKGIVFFILFGDFVLLSNTLLLNLLSFFATGDNMTVANELDGLLGCLSDTIESSMTVDTPCMEKSSSLSTASDLKSIFNIMENEYRTSEDSQELDGKQQHSLLTRVINTVFLAMGHTSSIVRQHAGQVFLRIYYLLPVTPSPSSSKDAGQYCSDYIKCTAPAILPVDQNDEKYISQYSVDSRRGMLGIVSNALIDKRKWQRQEVSLILSEEIIQTILFAALEAMGQESWKGFTLSDCEHVLISSCRKSSRVSLLHPMFEVRRMHGQILPTVARASILFQPDMLVEEFISSNRNTVNGLPTPTGLSFLISSSNNDDVEDECDEDRGDCRPVVLCAWIACLCNAAEHIIELDTGSNSHFQEALLRSKIDRTTVDSPPTPYSSWAMDVLGRLSEEVSKKRYSSGLKGVLYGENLSAYTALATSLSCVRNILGEAVQLLWSPRFDKNSMTSSSSSSSNNSSSSNSGSDEHSNSSSSSMNGTHTFIGAKKLLLSDAISCDFIDAAVLSAALLQKLDHDKFSSIVAHILRSLGEVPLKRSTDKAVSDVSTVHVRRKSFDDSNNDINRCRVSEEQHSLLPVFLICMRAIMRSAKDQYALHSHSHSHSNSHSMSRGSSCRSTPCSSPLKQSHHFPCRIDMRPYSFVANTEHDIGSNGNGISSPRSFISSSSPSSAKKITEIRELENTSFNINGSPSSICNEEYSSSPSQIRGFAFALRKHSTSKTLTPSPVIASAPKSISFPDALHLQQASNRSSNNQYLTHWVLIPSLMDPTTDLSKGILRVESSSISTHRWLCESLAPLLPSLGIIIICQVKLSYVMLCYVMLCYVMLCYVMLCYVM